jgi:hypothetical protein
MGWLKSLRWAVFIVLLLAGSSAYGLHSLSEKQRWASAHGELMPQLQEAIKGRPATASPQAVGDLPPRLAKLYPLGIELARSRYDARAKCMRLAAEGVDFICTEGEELVAGKRDRTNVYSETKLKSEALESSNREFLDAHLNFSNWQGETYAAWNEVWPQHNLDLSLEGSGLYLNIDAARLAPVQQKLMAWSDKIYAPGKKDRSYELSKDDLRTSTCIEELFALNNAVFSQAASADRGATYISRGPKDNWIDRLLAGKQTAAKQHNAGTFTSQTPKASP